MAMTWIHESPARWDAEKARIVGGGPAGMFDYRYRSLRQGDLVGGEWWRAEEGGRVVGYGWLDVSFGDAEILLATDPECRGRGVGAFVLEHLDAEARARKLNYLTNVIKPSHPQGAVIARWLQRHGFRASDDGRLVRAVGLSRA